MKACPTIFEIVASYGITPQLKKHTLAETFSRQAGINSTIHSTIIMPATTAFNAAIT